MEIMEKMEIHEKRKHRRASFRREIMMNSVDGKSAVIHARDISTSGIGLFAELPRTQGELLRLQFDLIQNGKKRQVNIAGEVKHVELAEHGYNFGVRFL